MNKEALIVIPGLDSKEVGFALKRVVDSISDKQTIATVKKINNPEKPNSESLEVTFNNSLEVKKIDVYEVFWGDIITENYSDNIKSKRKIFFGLELIIFWLFSPIWKAASKNKWMFIGICFSGLVITLWYFSIIGVVLSAIETYDPIRKLLPKIILIPPLLANIYVLIGLLLSVLPTALILKASGFTMKFIKDPGIRRSVKNRIQLLVNAIEKDEEYEQITFFSHSLGVIPALDFLSKYDNPNNLKIKSITIGAAISFLSHKTNLFREYLDECRGNENIDAWLDYFSKEDWLCSYESINSYGDHFESKELKMDSSWGSRFNSKIHIKYFDDTEVIEKLIT
ncbi:MAG: hypothetical protein JXR05_10920 [Flavobacteriaceae bacterium]